MSTPLPESFTERMKGYLGDEASSFFDSYNDAPKKGIRLNLSRLSSDIPPLLSGLDKVPWEPEGFYYSKDLALGKSPLHSAGAYYIQEPSAMAPVSYMDIREDMCVLDLCAAPGGKSTQIASYLKGTGLIISNEIIRERAGILSRNIERLGISNALVLNHSPKELSERFPACFDRILVDAPCSGEGMFRKDENAINEWKEDTPSLCAARGSTILEEAALMLKPGGIIVYSTCTFAKEENEDQISSFLSSHPEYSLINASPKTGMRCGYIPKTIRIWPQDGFGEGHFLAVLKRNGTLTPDGYGYKFSKENSVTKKESSMLKPYLEFIDDNITCKAVADRLKDKSSLFFFGKNLCLMPYGGLPVLKGLKAIRTGLELGSFKNDRFIPSHALALAISDKDVKRSISFFEDSKEIRDYLNGQAIKLKDPALSDKGYCLISVSSVSLGWARISNGMLKNHYPKGLRINYQ